MEHPSVVKILFIAGFGPIVRDAGRSRKLYLNDLGLKFKEETGGYLHTEALQGAKTFALWPLAQAAQSCFGSEVWPSDIPVPQAWLEFEVDSLEEATAALEHRGHRVLIRLKKEPWGQTVSRFISPEGLLVAVTCTPSMRKGE
jgi:hypothetical protein